MKALTCVCKRICIKLKGSTHGAARDHSAAPGPEQATLQFEKSALLGLVKPSRLNG
jgi:hypothetical protein